MPYGFSFSSIPKFLAIVTLQLNLANLIFVEERPCLRRDGILGIGAQRSRYCADKSHLVISSTAVKLGFCAMYNGGGGLPLTIQAPRGRCKDTLRRE